MILKEAFDALRRLCKFDHVLGGGEFQLGLGTAVPNARNPDTLAEIQERRRSSVPSCTMPTPSSMSRKRLSN